MSKFDDNMSDLLDVNPSQKEITETPTKVQEYKTDVVDSIEEKTQQQIQKDLLKDYEESRKQLKSVVSKGAEAIDDILTIARESEHPRAFEVAATMIKTVADANEKLLVIQKQMREITGQKNSGQLNVNKAAIFVGSTAELSKLIKNEMKIVEDE